MGIARIMVVGPYSNGESQIFGLAQGDIPLEAWCVYEVVETAGGLMLQKVGRSAEADQPKKSRATLMAEGRFILTAEEAAMKAAAVKT